MKIITKNVFKISFLLIILISYSIHSQSILTTPKKSYKGNAILGNGNLCAVYSDDPRIVKIKGTKGIQHLYYKDYTADYVASTSFDLYNDRNELLTGKDSTRMKNFYTTFTSTNIANKIFKKVTCFVHPQDAVILNLIVNSEYQNIKQNFNITLRRNIITDTSIFLSSIAIVKKFAIASWSNGTVLLAACKEPTYSINITDSTINFLRNPLLNKSISVIIVLAKSIENAQKKITTLLEMKDIYSSADSYWNNWLSNGKMPKFKIQSDENSIYSEYFKRTLYSVKAACINGQIPADITGQFLTNNMPQLYPRDAMMCARVFLLTGHLDEAKQIISFWCKPDIPKKSPGEFYARYDANAKAVDAGSGARYDEPEWDANGYLIQLLNQYHDLTNEWLADKDFIYELADFLSNHINDWGLLYEGGIVEWTGYLPATNMVCAAALKTAYNIAVSNEDLTESIKFKNAYEKISSSLIKMYDKNRKTYAAVRFHGVKAGDNSSIITPTKDTLYLWDTSLYFGILWGYPNHDEMENTVNFIEQNCVKLNGGVQYFEAKDNAWLSEYGGDLFFFTTAASAEYESLYGKLSVAHKYINWMIEYSNIYGLMPERIIHNGADCSEASPLSWCNAEFAAAVLTYSQNVSYKELFNQLHYLLFF